MIYQWLNRKQFNLYNLSKIELKMNFNNNYNKCCNFIHYNIINLKSYISIKQNQEKNKFSVNCMCIEKCNKIYLVFMEFESKLQVMISNSKFFL